jgi:hypothetical protein
MSQISIQRINSLEAILLGITVGDVAAILYKLGNTGGELFYVQQLGQKKTINELIKTSLKDEAAHHIHVYFWGGSTGSKRYSGSLKTFVMDRILFYSQFQGYNSIIIKIQQVLREPLPF